jgi:FAD/FMN-containing dehydrogenase
MIDSISPASEGFRGSFETDATTVTRHSDASGILRLRPRAVAVPRDADDVEALLRWADRTRTPLVPRAAATGMPGGNVGEDVVVDLMSNLRAVRGIAGERAWAEPGVTRAELNAAGWPHGLHFPVDPSSGTRCTLGGMIANNASGAHSVRYGATRAWVESLDVVLADGSRCRATRGQPPTGRLAQIAERIDVMLRNDRAAIEAVWPKVRKNSSGYALLEYLRSGDVVDLLVGSEGTLAVLVGAEIRLSPLPRAQGLALLEFTSLDAVAHAVQAVLPLRPATCEMMDRTLIELIRQAGADADYPLRPDLEAILLVEVEAESRAETETLLDAVATAAAGFADRVVCATERDAQERFWHVRHAASPLIGSRSDGRVSMQFIEDGVVPVERLPEYVRSLRSVLEAYGVPAVIFGHAGEGNLHVNPLVDVSAPGWAETIEHILYEIAEVVAALGGTMAGEHGDGRLRAPLLERIWGVEMVARFQRVKDEFDPKGILNPGVILPLPGQRPLDALRAYP